ncbi:glycoside hydrolase family 9 protein [Pseudoxanthomonas daejeonensis]|uniref:glycoside hydrolase family 9 protein n=1 Tax=Pseudoxanthomonas daejeonensis TaxID=266062 RepID=UPI003CE5815C
MALSRAGHAVSAGLAARLLLLLGGIGACVACQTQDPFAGTTAHVGQVRMNQLGFLPGAQKLAVVEGDRALAFVVEREEGGGVVLSGTTTAPAAWKPARREAAIADLGALTAPGRYRVRVEGLPPSDPFPVDAQAYSALADASLKSFYLIRSGTPVEAAHAGRFARAAGHPDETVEIHASAASPGRPAGTVVSAPGGWYDAGDYNKYVVNSGITTWTLLAAYEHFPEFFRGRELGIPESGDGVPDILDEAWWNLRWMLAMQDPGDGGVYHKLTNLRFDGMVMPDQAVKRRYMVGRSTAAALDFAAVMATASRVYASYEAQFPGEPARMRAAAEAAWRWAQAHPDSFYRQPQDVRTGAYGDEKLDDEFAWAAAELYLLTGDAHYLEAFARHARDADVPNWADVGALGWISLAAHRQRLPAASRDAAERQVGQLAARLAAQSRESPWRVAMQPRDFVWGSNAVALNQAMVLLQAYRLERERTYLDAAQSQLDYVLGRNPLGVSFVTGHGLRTPMHIHHRPSQADGIASPVPGLLSGGPNPSQQDRADCKGVAHYRSAVPALSWIDHDCSYASNETAINWNAPLVYVSSAIQYLAPL